MNLKEFHDPHKEVSTKLVFAPESSVTALQILENALLKEHITKVPALLVCVQGEVIFENEHGAQYTLHAGDYVHIEPMIKHWIKGLHTSQLLLIK